MTTEHSSETAQRAKEDWRARIGRRSDHAVTEIPELEAPKSLRAVAGAGHVTLDWESVPGAVGYLVHRADDADGPYEPVDHLGGDVLAVPHPPYSDTTGQPGRTYHYRVATLSDVDIVGPLGESVSAAASTDPAGPVSLTVSADRVAGSLARPWAPMIGSEHLSHLLSTDTTGGRPIGKELTEALILAKRELGVETVRAHAILCDDVGVYREVDGRPVHDFSQVDRIYDHVLSLGLRPIVELSFMPKDLASDPTKTVFAYGAIISPPKDWGRWASLITELVAHLVDRYGLDEVRAWAFEVWNEANLDVFWSGTRDEYLRLYDVTARAVKAVDPDLVVGGPASAAAGWNGELLAYAAETGSPVDFISTHTYGSPPLDFRPLCERFGRPDLDLLWTEWGVTPTHFNPISDGPLSAAFLLRGMRSAAERIEALAYWVASDHFEELGRPPRLFHGGFGLLTVGNLRKPRYWALAALSRLGEHELVTRLDGDGAGGLVETWCSRDEDGRVSVLVWNGTLDQSKGEGCDELARRIELTVTGLTRPSYRLTHRRIDQRHSNIAARWREFGGADWPTTSQWEKLAEVNLFDEYEPERTVEPQGGHLRDAFSLPMPGISLLEFTPED